MLNVTVGQYRFDRPDPYERVYLVKSIFLHPQYHDANKTNNIALVEVRTAVLPPNYNRRALINVT